MTEVANVLFTSQPGVSRQIRKLEEELGVDIFERNGKRLTGLTEPEKGVLPIIERLLLEVQNLHQASSEYSGQTKGTLAIATTHTQARYVLPKVVQQFRQAFPEVRIALQQSSPEHIAEWGMSGKADLRTDIVLTAMDSDVIQQYVALGLGVGIVASMAIETNRTNGLRTTAVDRLFTLNVTRLAVRRGAYLRTYTYDFICQFAPVLSKEDIRKAIADADNN